MSYNDTNFKFFKDSRKICFCKICGTEYQKPHNRRLAELKLCYHCRKLLYIKRYKKRWASLTKEEKQKIYQKNYVVWKRWCKKNPERRRRLALESYHRRKNDPKNKARRHIRTKKPS